MLRFVSLTILVVSLLGVAATVGTGASATDDIQHSSESKMQPARALQGRPTDVPTSTAIPPTPTRTPTPTATPARTWLQRRDDGFRLQSESGQLRPNISWVKSWGLLANWQGSHNVFSYLADLSSGNLHIVASGHGNHRLRFYPQDDGNLAVVVRLNDGFLAFEEMELLDLSTGSIQRIYSAIEDLPQWAGPEDHKAKVNGKTFLRGRWTGRDTFVATLQSFGSYDYVQGNADDFITTREGWGTVFLVDVKSKDVRILMERGQVSAILPDGTLIMRPGWLHDETQVLRPPYSNAPERIAPAGPWTWGWNVSPDGRKVAWLEMTPPPGDWSALAPWDCCDGYDRASPPPTPNFIVVWDSVKNELTRYPVTNYAWSGPHHNTWNDFSEQSWSYHEQLDWGRDSASVFYATFVDNKYTALHRLNLDGELVTLAVYEGKLSMKVIAESSDGSIAYKVYKMGCLRCLQVERRYTNGTFQVIRQNSELVDWIIDGQGRLITITGYEVTVYDLHSGRLRYAVFQDRANAVHLPDRELNLWMVRLSPDGRWAVATDAKRRSIDILTLKVQTSPIYSKGSQVQ